MILCLWLSQTTWHSFVVRRGGLLDYSLNILNNCVSDLVQMLQIIMKKPLTSNHWTITAELKERIKMWWPAFQK